MKDDRLPNTVLIGQPSRAKPSSSSPNGVGGCSNKILKGNWNFLKGAKKKALNRFGLKRSVRSCVGFR